MKSSVRIQREAAARLHQTLLAASPIVGLGSCFIIDYYYADLIKDDIIRCDLFKVGDAYAGFLAYTKYPGDFMRRGIRRHGFHLMCVLTWCLWQKPSRIGALVDTVQHSIERGNAPIEDGIGEFLSFGVLPEYAGYRDRETGLRISHMLFDHAIAFFRGERFREIHWNLAEGNTAAMLFYQSYAVTIKEMQMPWATKYRVKLKL